MLVLPGITSPAITMDFLVRELTDLVRPIVLDVRGRGLSDNAPAPEAADGAGSLLGYDLAAYAADVDAVISGLRLERPILFGHSMGARIAALVATTSRHELGGTVLVDPPMSAPGRSRYPTTLDAFLAQLDQARRGTDANEVAGAWPRWPGANGNCAHAGCPRARAPRSRPPTPASSPRTSSRCGPTSPHPPCSSTVPTAPS